MKNNSCTCIIPFYNEQERVLGVLSKLGDIRYFDEIILVNDGSQDKSLDLVQDFVKKHRNKRIRIISYTKNKGKAHAIHQGVKQARTKYVFMFDSDLKNIKKNEIIYAIQSMYQHPEIDMGILRRIYAKRYIKLFYRELLLSGQRILKTRDLHKIFQEKFEGYQLEVAINTFMEKNKKITVRYPFSAENSFKSEKWGLLEGRKKDFFMFRDIFKYQGLRGYIRHSFAFSPIYEKKYNGRI